MHYQIDPLDEKAHEVLPGLIWKYNNRVLLLTTLSCPSGCAFCFRAHLHTKNKQRASNEEVVEFILRHPSIKELIFSGGEPLLKIADIVSLTKQLQHQVDIFRIHTRLPVTHPDLVPLDELRMLSYQIEKPFYLVIHVNSPTELSPPTRTILLSLRKAGYIMLSHTVFLRGINNSSKTLAGLFSDLISLGVKPYYIFHCDHMKHTTQFEVPLEEEVSIMSTLRKQVSGLAYPLHVIDSASGRGKIPIPTHYWHFDSTIYADFDKEWLTTEPR